MFDVAKGAGLRKYAVDTVLRKLIPRARELGLCLPESAEETRVQLCICLTAMLCEDRFLEDYVNGGDE